MSTQVICDHCQKPMDLRAFNLSQTTVIFTYGVSAVSSDGISRTFSDVCPHCAIVILTQLVATWGG